MKCWAWEYLATLVARMATVRGGPEFEGFCSAAEMKPGARDAPAAAPATVPRNFRRVQLPGLSMEERFSDVMEMPLWRIMWTLLSDASTAMPIQTRRDGSKHLIADLARRIQRESTS